VDILVDLKEPTFDNYMDLKFYLEEILNHPVDLVIHDTVKPRLKPIIEQEVVYA
jgi:predicted nucleotidyltransferase